MKAFRLLGVLVLVFILAVSLLVGVAQAKAPSDLIVSSVTDHGGVSLRGGGYIFIDVHGSYPTSCAAPLEISQQVVGRSISVQMRQVIPVSAGACKHQPGSSYSETIAIARPLIFGTYSVNVNGVVVSAVAPPRGPLP